MGLLNFKTEHLSDGLPAEGNKSREKVFLEHYRWLLGCALQFTRGQRERAEDLVHDTFVQFQVKKVDVGAIDDVRRYLNGILRNLFLLQVRRAARYSIQEFSLLDHDSADMSLRSQSPLDQFQSADLLVRACNFVCYRKETSVPASILILRFFHGYYTEEICRITGAQRRQVNKWLLRGRNETKSFLENPHPQPSPEPSRKVTTPQTPRIFLARLRQMIFDSCATPCTVLEQAGETNDAEGARIAKGTLSAAPASYTATCAPPLGSGFTITARYLVDLGGNQVTELSEQSGEVWKHSNVFSAARLTATYDTSGLHYSLADPLGTKRVQANISGQIEESCISLPFGDALNCTPTALATADDATEHHFTGKERDTESGNDYFMARYYASSMGRFMSPDWSAKEDPVPYARIDNPQTLNLYAYVLNNPLIHVDADGHQCGQGGQSPCTDQQKETGHVPIAPGGTSNPEKSKFLQTVKSEGNGLVQAEPGKLVMFGGTTELSATANAGFAQINSTGSTSLQVVPGAGLTADITMHAPGATPNPIGVSAGGPGGSVSVTPNSLTLSVGPVISPPKAGPMNVSVDTGTVVKAISNVATSVVNGVKSFFSSLSSLPTPPQTF
jgi:RNA polymerase sigma factor (sigma-70 family)